MQALIIPFNEVDADIQFIVNRLLRRKKAFEVTDAAFVKGFSEKIADELDLSEKFKDPFFVELGETIDHIRAIQRGEIDDNCQDAFEFLAELESELKTEKNLEHAH